MAITAVTSRLITAGQRIEFETQVKAGRINFRVMEAFLSGKSPFEIPTDPIKQWELFYRRIFKAKVDFSYVKIPINHSDFNQALFMAEGLDYDIVEEMCNRHFKQFWKWEIRSLSYHIDMNKEARTTERSYAIRVRDCIEADEIHKDKSAKMLIDEGVSGQTLLERLVHGLFIFWIAEKHLDYKNVTLCTSSRYRDGGVPHVRFDPFVGSVRVHWHSIGLRHEGLRVRELVF